MKTYFTNGTMGDVKYFIDDLAEFQIQELAGDNSNRYIYPGDTINYTLDSELVKLYDVLRDLYFDDVKTPCMKVNIECSYINYGFNNISPRYIAPNYVYLNVDIVY